MSADNYGLCPKCLNDIKENENKLKKLYGRVSIDEYKKLQGQLRDKEDCRTFRECYEIGIHNGSFEVNYSGECNECGYQYVFKIEKKIIIE